MVLKKKKVNDLRNNKKPRTKLKLRQKIKIKAKEIPALLRAKKEEKKHLPTTSEIQKEHKAFEKYALLMKKLILR